MSLLQQQGLQLPGLLIPHDGFISSILNLRSPVKLRITDQTETRRIQEPEDKNMYGLHVIEEMNNPNSDTEVQMKK